MCQRTTCRTCRKATYRGCGQHVEQVLAGVPASQRCTCRTQAKRAASKAEAGPAQHGTQGQSAGRRRFLGLFGRR
ncbi:hypothetical protein ABIA33_002316 [Streptacidiphilus sp. MAP12-16]